MNDKYEIIKVGAIVIGTIAVVSGPTAVIVHHHDQTEMKLAKADVARIQDKAATEIKLAAVEVAQAKAEVARIESERKAAVHFWEAQVERYKQDLEIGHTKNYAPYQTAILQNKRKEDRRKKRRRTSFQDPA